MDTGAVVVKAVGNGIRGNGGQGSQIGHVGPKSIARGQVCRVNLSCLAGVKVFLGILQRPTIHIGHLGALVAHNAPHVARLHHPGTRVPGRNFNIVNQSRLSLGHGLAQGLVESVATVFGWNLFRGVARNGFGTACQRSPIYVGHGGGCLIPNNGWR